MHCAIVDIWNGLDHFSVRIYNHIHNFRKYSCCKNWEPYLFWQFHYETITVRKYSHNKWLQGFSGQQTCQISVSPQSGLAHHASYCLQSYQTILFHLGKQTKTINVHALSTISFHSYAFFNSLLCYSEKSLHGQRKSHLKVHFQKYNDILQKFRPNSLKKIFWQFNCILTWTCNGMIFLWDLTKISVQLDIS